MEGGWEERGREGGWVGGEREGRREGGRKGGKEGGREREGGREGPGCQGKLLYTVEVFCYILSCKSPKFSSYFTL